MVEEGRFAIRRIVRGVGFHRRSHELLRRGIFHPAGVAANMKDHFFVEPIRQMADEIPQLGAIGRGAGAEGKDLIAASRVGRRLGKAGRIELRAMPPDVGGLMVSRPTRRRHGPAPSLWLGKRISTTIDMSK